MASENEEREVLTWEGYGKAARELAGMVADSGFRPDLILAIARGGLFPAGSLGYALSVKNLYVMNLEFYSGVDERLDVPVMLPPYLDKFDLTDATNPRRRRRRRHRTYPEGRLRLLPGGRGREPDRGALRESPTP